MASVSFAISEIKRAKGPSTPASLLRACRRASPLAERPPAQLSWLGSCRNSLLSCQVGSKLLAHLSPTCSKGRAGRDRWFSHLPRLLL